MAHAEHFLQRLERIEVAGEVDFALALYRDKALISYILGKARLPEGTNRVALSLSEGSRGPFIIVERDGEFVTCLGEGMQHDLPMIKRGQLDHIVSEAEHWRQQHKNAEALVAKDGGVRRIAEHLLTAGGALGREEFQALALWMPMLRADLLKIFLDYATEIHHANPDMYALLHKKPTAQRRKKMRLFTNRIWALGHLGLLLGNDEHSFWEKMHAHNPALLINLPELMTQTGVVSIGLRAALVAAKFGRLYLDSFEANPPPLIGQNNMVGQMICLSAVALRHRKLRGRVRKLLKKMPANLNSPTKFDSPLGRVHKTLLKLMMRLLKEPDNLTGLAREKGQILFSQMAQTQDAPPWLAHFSAPEELPDELALPVGANFAIPYLEPSDNMIVLLSALSWVARAKAEELYYPQKIAKALFDPWHHREALLCIESIDHLRRHRYAQHNDAKIGRNDPCPCGSGRKYKHCCGKPGAQQDGRPAESS